jgi:hypothetical protein
MKTISSVKISQISIAFNQDSEGKENITAQADVQFLDEASEVFTIKTLPLPLTAAQKTTIAAFKTNLENKAKEQEGI